MSRYNDPAHLPMPVKGPTWEDIDRDTDEAYDRWAEAQPEQNLFVPKTNRLDPFRSWPFPEEA